MFTTAASKEMWVGRARTLAFFVLAMLVAASVGVLIAAKPAHADTIRVNSMADAFDNNSTDGECDTTRFPQPGTEPSCTLRAAIQEANANGETDMIIFDPALSGTITLTLGGLEIANDTPANDLNIQGPGAGTISVSGNEASRIFFINQSTGVTISGLTISDGRNAISGGGIYNFRGALDLINSTVSGNTAENGGGIYNFEGEVRLVNSTVSGNTATDLLSATAASGGGLYNRGALDLTNSTVSDNTAEYGGGLFSTIGTLELSSTTVSENTASIAGGGIFSSGVSLTLSNSTVSGNTASNAGGIGNSTGPLTLSNSTVSGNTATTSFGGGIVNSSGAQLTNTTVSGNIAGTAAGGIYNYSISTLRLTNSTVSGNTASNAGGNNSLVGGGGLYNSNNGTVTLANTIVARNISTIDPDAKGTFTSQGKNLIGNTTGSSGWGASDLKNVNPLLGPLQNNGGPTNTHALLAGSPALGAIPVGTSRCATATEATTTDQRGISRPQGQRCDIGSFELENAAPVARADSFRVKEDKTLRVTAPAVLRNDTDVNDDRLSASMLTSPRHGTLTLRADGSLVYKPKRNFNGVDSFTYRASDGTLFSKTATVTVRIAAVPG